MKPPKLLADGPMMMEAKGAIVELSRADGFGTRPRLIQLIKTPSPAHATCAVVRCVCRRAFFSPGVPDPPRA
jgi:hypothetical protein